MREMGIVDSKKALLINTFFKNEYQHSIDFTFCFVPLINFKYQNQYVNEWESLESVALS